MIFPSHIFLVLFLPVALALWHGLPSRSARLLSLTVMSYVFYGWWDWRFTALMLGSTLVDYIAGKRIHEAADQRQRRGWLMVSLVANLSSLGFFKYFDFFASSVNAVAAQFGWDGLLPVLEIILPVGISFYTFQSLSYSIDIYRRQCAPATDFLTFAAYVSMFPQLVAGPIVRYQDIEDQLREIHARSSLWENGRVADGVWLFTIGIIKKIWIADSVAPIADAAFDGSGTITTAAAWAGALAYTVQLYFDFSGYSDMALGLGRLLGFEFPVNFNSPYKAMDPSDFWRRWHISLSQWLRDYLFIPLGGSRHTKSRTLRNLLITMLLGGLWHGAAWSFVLWGAYHGVLLAVHAIWQGFKRPLPTPLAIVLMFLATVVGWVMFRATTLDRALELYRCMVGFGAAVDPGWVHPRYGISLPAFVGEIGLRPLGVCAAALVLIFAAPNSQNIKRPRHAVVGVACGLALFATLLRLSEATPFLYFQF